MNQSLLTTAELAAILRKSVASVNTDLTRNPAALPPSFKPPNTRTRFWLRSTVDAWLIELARKNNALPDFPREQLGGKHNDSRGLRAK
jgi:hypothetical protein